MIEIFIEESISYLRGGYPTIMPDTHINRYKKY